MVKWFCDRCGAELHIGRQCGYSISFRKRAGYGPHSHGVELCEPCGAPFVERLIREFAAEIERHEMALRVVAVEDGETKQPN